MTTSKLMQKYTAKEIVDMYLDYVNNFLLVSTFANHYMIEHDEANDIINLGRYINEYVADINNK